MAATGNQKIRIAIAGDAFSHGQHPLHERRATMRGVPKNEIPHDMLA